MIERARDAVEGAHAREASLDVRPGRLPLRTWLSHGIHAVIVFIKWWFSEHFVVSRFWIVEAVDEC